MTPDVHFIDAVQNSWNRFSLSQKKQYVVVFYRILFNQHPEYKSLFSHDLEQVRDGISNTITELIENLSDSEYLQTVFSRLGRKHQSLNVTTGMFIDARQCHVQAMSEVSGGYLSDQEKQNWRQLFEYFSNSILQSYH